MLVQRLSIKLRRHGPRPGKLLLSDLLHQRSVASARHLCCMLRRLPNPSSAHRHPSTLLHTVTVVQSRSPHFVSSIMASTQSKDEQIQSLRKLFAESKVPNDPKAWDQAWIDSTTPWDANKPQPALVELLQGAHDAETNVADVHGKQVPVSQAIPKGDGVAVVPGCGRGYDAKVFAERGLTTYGVDISSNAVAAANKVSIPYPDVNLEHRLGRLNRSSFRIVSVNSGSMVRIYQPTSTTGSTLPRPTSSRSEPARA